jgi:pimeloyl-ACP methyl ester carboxylesterase
MRERRRPLIATTPIEYEVATDDGITLCAEMLGKPSSPVTVVLCHGYGLNMHSWCFQRAALASRARVLTWDQRGHGRSGFGEPGSGTIDQLGRDLYQVITQLAPTGPIVLVGHSMGGMTIMALAEQFPDLFGERIIAVALLATSAGPVCPSLGLPTGGAAIQLAAHWAAERVSPGLIPLLRLVRRLPGYRDMAREVIRRLAFASAAVSPALVDLLLDMLESTPLHGAAELFRQFLPHDRRAALSVLERVSTLVMVGDNDLITPPRDSAAIARAIPGADLVVLPDCGHALILERAEQVNEWLVPLLEPASVRNVS